MSHVALAKKLLRARDPAAILMIEVTSSRVHLSHFARVKAIRFAVGVRLAHQHGARGVRINVGLQKPKSVDDDDEEADSLPDSESLAGT